VLIATDLPDRRGAAISKVRHLSGGSQSPARRLISFAPSAKAGVDCHRRIQARRHRISRRTTFSRSRLKGSIPMTVAARPL